MKKEPHGAAQNFKLPTRVFMSTFFLPPHPQINGFHFDKCDEEVATAFSVYCGISIMHALVHKQVQKAEARYKLSQELLLYHMKVE